MTDARGQRLAALAAIDTALADPVRLVRVLQEAADDEAALDGLQREFGLDAAAAAIVLDQQFRLLTRRHRARHAAELAVLRAEWGPPAEARLRFEADTAAVLTVEGGEHPFRGHHLAQDVLREVVAFLFREVARPRLRPVVVAVAGLDGGPGRITVDPDGSARFEDYPGDAQG
ncbi:hypothetical protein ACI782_13740 [Geodermatophilus sp. SYSU D00703]